MPNFVEIHVRSIISEMKLVYIYDLGTVLLFCMKRMHNASRKKVPGFDPAIVTFFVELWIFCIETGFRDSP